MRSVISLLCLGLLLAVVSAPGLAATYYVATNGNDNNDGSSGSPWLTLKKAADTVVAGDTVIVRNGTYAGWHVYSNKGTASNPITFRAENTGQVTLNAKASNAAQNAIIEIEGNTGLTSEYWVVDGFVVDGVNKSLMAVDCRWVDHCTFQNLTVYQSSSRGLYISHGNYNLTYNCVSHDNGEHGSYCANAGTYNTFVQNTCYNNTSEGMQTNGDLSMGGNGLGLYYVYEKNVIYGNADKGLNFDGLCNSTVRNNLIYNNQGGIALFSIDAAKGSSDDLIYNNTIIIPTTGQWGVVIRSSKDTHGSGPDPVGNKIKNNILYNYRNDGSHGAICTYSSSASGFESDYNAVVDVFSINSERSFINLATWRTYGYDIHSFISTPTALFVNPGANDYHLKAGSPAINAGVTLSEVTDDMDGNSRPQGSAYDVGCYEYIEGISDLVITTTSLPAGTVGTAYSQTVQAAGGVTPYSWSVASGLLPAGLSLGSSTGTISGTPTTAGTSYFTVQVSDSQQPADTDTQALSIVVNAAPQGPTITTTSLPNGTRGVPYSQTVQATGGTLPYTWSKTAGTLPNGLTLNASSGVISGTPSKRGTFNFTIRCTDAVSLYDDQALSIIIN